VPKKCHVLFEWPLRLQDFYNLTVVGVVSKKSLRTPVLKHNYKKRLTLNLKVTFVTLNYSISAFPTLSPFATCGDGQF
jgi:hypothetical protein